MRSLQQSPGAVRNVHGNVSEKSLLTFTSRRTVGAEKLRFSWTRCDCICRYPITSEFDCHSPRKAFQGTLSGSVACSEWQSSRDEARNIDDAAESRLTHRRQESLG